MMSHRLVRCSSPARLSSLARKAHAPCASWRTNAFRHWRCSHETSRTSAVHWYEWLPGVGLVGCCLDSEQGATGVVAHLTTSVIVGAGVLPTGLRMIILHRWTRHALALIADDAEHEAGSRDGST